MKLTLLVAMAAAVAAGLTPEMEAQLKAATAYAKDVAGIPIFQSNWVIHVDTRQPEASRMLNAAADWVRANVADVPRRGNLSIEMAPTNDALSRLMTADLFADFQKAPRVFAYANKYDRGEIITMMSSALKYDWMAKAVLLHELSHVRQFREGRHLPTECKRLAHEIRATTYEINHHNAVGVPLIGKGLTFRQGSAILLRRYKTDFLTHNCNGR